MPTIRQLIDVKAADTMDKGDVFKQLEKTKRSQLSYKMDKMKLHQRLAPAKQMMDLIDKEHPLDSDAQEIDPTTGLPMIQPNMGNQQQTPGKQMMPGGGQPNQRNQMQQKSPQQQRPGSPNVNKSSPQNSKGSNTNSKSASGKDKGKGRFEIHVKADAGKIDQLNVKKKMKANDYHNNTDIPGGGVGRGMGLSTSRRKY